MGDAEFAGDDRNARKAFSHGPRNCLGKKLEIRMNSLSLLELQLIGPVVLLTRKRR